MPSWQMTQVLSLHTKGAMTKSPSSTVLTAEPTCSTTPMNSWPICQGVIASSLRYCQRSLPQMQLATTRTTASEGSTMRGSGSSSRRMSRWPWMRVAFMGSF